MDILGNPESIEQHKIDRRNQDTFYSNVYNWVK